MKCWNSEFNGQGSKVTILVVQVEAVKIYVVSELETKIGVGCMITPVGLFMSCNQLEMAGYGE
jgi:hypothetical protein